MNSDEQIVETKPSGPYVRKKSTETFAFLLFIIKNLGNG